MTLAPQEIELVCQLVDDLAGIQWDAEKTYLIESRLGKLLEDQGGINLTELVTRVRRGDSGLRTAVVDAVTTRETLFFRDDAPFSALRNKALPEIIDTRAKTAFPRRLRLWSAACSSGQEPYSLGITLCEMIDDIDDWDVVITATDLSAAAIEAASRGVYSDFEMSRGVSPELRDRYFRQTAGGWQICDRVRSLVSFQPRNLLEPYTNLGPFDVIFCRNVAIYFDVQVKIDLFQRLSQVLAPHGAIFVGGSETLSFMGERWKPRHHCRAVYYQPHVIDRNISDSRAVSTSHNRPAPTSKAIASTTPVVTKTPVSAKTHSEIQKQKPPNGPVRAVTKTSLLTTATREARHLLKPAARTTSPLRATTVRTSHGLNRRVPPASMSAAQRVAPKAKQPSTLIQCHQTPKKSITVKSAAALGGAAQPKPSVRTSTHVPVHVLANAVAKKKPLGVSRSVTDQSTSKSARPIMSNSTKRTSAPLKTVSHIATSHPSGVSAASRLK